ncbi:MAG: thioesterase family protein [Candidatus Methylomirabilis oxyfera]|nr:thioesterase family protein [Candidatus Methylomirabilis oxyfera]
MGLQQGMTFELIRRVGDEVTAHHLGNEGFHVLATPIIVAWFEEAARTLAALHLEPGLGTVGALVTAKHLAPTPVGMTVTVKATLREMDGRRLLFDLEARDDTEKIAEGHNERIVVSVARFREKLARKQTS